MSRLIACVVLISLSISCAKAPQEPEFTDDYVLIEFAARLEEDYHSTSGKPLEPNAQPPVE